MSYKRVSSSHTKKKKKPSAEIVRRRELKTITKTQSDKIVEVFKSIQAEFGNTIVYFDDKDLAKHSSYSDGINHISIYKNGTIAYGYLDRNRIFRQGIYRPYGFDALMSRLKRFQNALRTQKVQKQEFEVETGWL